MMEFLKASQEGKMAENKANREMMAEMKTQIEKIKAEMITNHQKVDSCLGEAKSSPETTKACEQVTHACLVERKEPAPEEPKAVAETAEVHEGATDEEAIGVTEDRSRDLRRAVRCRGRLKTRTKCDVVG
jgi:hypothetical protein